MIIWKIIKLIATRNHILRLKCTKFDSGWGSAQDPAGGAYSAPPDTLGGFKGALLTIEVKERERDVGREKGEEREGERGGAHF